MQAQIQTVQKSNMKEVQGANLNIKVKRQSEALCSFSAAAIDVRMLKLLTE